MSTTMWLVLLVLALVLGAAVAWFVIERQRRTRLKARFGPEYDRVVRSAGKPREAEKELLRREERVEMLHIRPLPPEERARFADAWRSVQAHFVDEPVRAVAEADELVEEAMERMGYPIGDFEQQSADVSVDHPEVVRNYRAAHTIAERSHQGRAETEELRQAMVHYRALFEDLLDTRVTDGGSPKEKRHAQSGIS